MNEEREKTKSDLLLVRKCITEKWKPILHRGKIEHGVEDCFLCAEYYNLSIDHDCKGCPIFQKTGRVHCHSTPYMLWEHAGFNRVEDKESAGYAVAEINFLRRLERDLQKKLNRRVGKLRLEKLSKKWK